MTVRELITGLSLETLVEGDLDRAVTGGYTGDLLSWVMGRAKAGDAWFSVMGNVNAVAVCVLADVACLVLCENAALDEAARARAELESVTILRSTATAYTLAGALSARLERTV
ncbi:MAG: hypothetical protein IJO75_01865 [Clostridia bacterium]|nr:hypothetical protein [Clostridia bacterium]